MYALSSPHIDSLQNYFYHNNLVFYYVRILAPIKSNTCNYCLHISFRRGVDTNGHILILFHMDSYILWSQLFQSILHFTYDHIKVPFRQPIHILDRARCYILRCTNAHNLMCIHIFQDNVI